MKLKDFLRSKPVADREAFAVACGTTLNYLKLVAYGAKPNVGADLCIAIERESGGAVRVEDLRPDIDWAFRRAAADFGDAPASQSVAA